MINPHSATAKDFDRPAQKKANSFWIYAISAAIVGYYFKWWAILPAVMAIVAAAQSLSATRCADQLRRGTYRILNPNNGAPNGDASNRE